MNERAGTPAQKSDLIDVEALIRAYYDLKPDVSVTAQRVVFGTSGHRGSSLEHGLQREPHRSRPRRRSWSTAPARASPDRCSSARDTHALSAPGARPRRSRCSSATTCGCSSTSSTTTCPPRRSRHAILAYNRGRRTTTRPTASSSPPATTRPCDGGFKYNPPHGGPADSDATSLDRQPRQRDHRRRMRDVRTAEPSAVETYDFRGHYVDDLENIIDIERHQGQRHPHRRRPAGRRERAATGARSATATSSTSPWSTRTSTRTWALHDPRLGRQDPDGPVQPLRDGLGAGAQGRLRHPHRQRRRRRPARHRHARRRPDEPEPLPGRGHRVPLQPPRRLAGGCRDRQDPRLLHHDRPRRRVPRPPRCGRCRSASSGSCPASIDGSVAFGGEESAGASFLRFDGTVWTTDKDGILLALLAARDRRRHRQVARRSCYAELAEHFGAPVYERVDAVATPAQKAALGKLDGAAITATELAGDPIIGAAQRTRRATARPSAASRSSPRTPGSPPGPAAPKTSTRSTPSRSRARSTSAGAGRGARPSSTPRSASSTPESRENCLVTIRDGHLARMGALGLSAGWSARGCSSSTRCRPGASR